MDLLELSRLQFSALMAFHLLFPAITLVLGWAIVVFRVNRKNTTCKMAIRFWMPVYALTVAFQIVSASALVTQFDLAQSNMPSLTLQGVVHLLRAWALGFALQVLGLAVIAGPRASLGEVAEQCGAIAAAVGSTLAVVVPLFLMDLIAQQSGWAGWGATLANVQVWDRVLHLCLASMITVGFLLASLSALRWQSGARFVDIPPTAIGGLVLAASAAIAGVVLHLVGHADHPGVPMVLALIAGLCLCMAYWFRHQMVLDQLPGVMLVAVSVLPLLGWGLLLWEWAFLPVPRFKLAAPQEAITVTFPLYIGTIGFLVLSYLIVLVTLARRSQTQVQTHASGWSPTPKS